MMEWRVLAVSWVAAMVMLVGRGAPAAEVGVSHPGILEARKKRDQGQFTEATRDLTRLRDAASTVTPELRRVIDLEIEKIRRTRSDYPMTREALLVVAQKRLKDFTEKELDDAIKAGHIEPLSIDGTPRFFVSALSNLMWRRMELQDRLVKPSEDQSLRRLYEVARAADAEATTHPQRMPLVTPQDWQATMTLTVPPGKVPPGQLVRAWLPYPQEIAHQTSVTLVSSDPPGGLIAPADKPQRSIYLERMATEGTTVTFQASYRYRTYARVFRPVADAVKPHPTGERSDWRQYLESRPPHLDLTDTEIRKTAQTIVGATTHPLQKVQAIHRWMIDNLIYQYAREYSTLDSLSRYTLDRKAGDCGQHGMLFIALCRASGVPARWTSGWEVFEGKGGGMHDWTEVWIEPYGWIPVDTDMAIVATKHNGGDLTAEEASWLSNFMLGNMDGRRLTVNVDYGHPLVPAKKDFRSETVDFQRGEVEADGKNLYFNDWDYEMEIAPVAGD